MATIALPWIAALLGVKFGADILSFRISEQAAAMGTSATNALQQTLAENGIESNALIQFLLYLLR